MGFEVGEDVFDRGTLFYPIPLASAYPLTVCYSPANPLNTPSPDLIRDEVDRITKSSSFRNSKRLREFLGHVVEETMAGRGEDLKAYNIGLEVFQRSAEFDAEKDGIVRVTAQRVRSALERYYLTEGRSRPIQIALPKGRYKAAFIAANHDPPSLGASLAIVPFENLSGDPSLNYIAGGLTEELLIRLGSCEDLEVVSRNAVSGIEASASAPRIGSTLDVAFVLRGSFRTDSSGYRIALELSETERGRQVWSK